MPNRATSRGNFMPLARSLIVSAAALVIAEYLIRAMTVKIAPVID